MPFYSIKEYNDEKRHGKTELCSDMMIVFSYPIFQYWSKDSLFLYPSWVPCFVYSFFFCFFFTGFYYVFPHGMVRVWVGFRPWFTCSAQRLDQGKWAKYVSVEAAFLMHFLLFVTIDIMRFNSVGCELFACLFSCPPPPPIPIQPCFAFEFSRYPPVFYCVGMPSGVWLLHEPKLGFPAPCKLLQAWIRSFVKIQMQGVFHHSPVPQNVASTLRSISFFFFFL